MTRIRFAVACLALHAAPFAAAQSQSIDPCGLGSAARTPPASCLAGPAERVSVQESALHAASAVMAVTAAAAWQLKRDLRQRALLVDIRPRSEIAYAGRPLGTDASVALLRPAAGFVVDPASGELAMEFDPRFLEHMDAALARAGLGHGDAVIVIGRTGRDGQAAAQLLHEHGYLQVFAVSDGFEGRVAPDEDWMGTRREGGWKNAGLPWTHHLDARRLPAAEFADAR